MVMNKIGVALLIFHICQAAKIKPGNQLTATSNTNSVYGSFRVDFGKDNSASYTWEFNLPRDLVESTCLTTSTCSSGLNAGLQWSLNSVWENLSEGGSGTGSTECSVANVGNHYDPNGRCGPESRFRLDQTCDNLIAAGFVDPNYDANCTTHDPFGCELGDLSGKMGNARVKSAKNRHQKHQGVMEKVYTLKGYASDPWPVPFSKYCPQAGFPCVNDASIPTNNAYGSVVFSCPCGQRLFCAQLEDTSHSNGNHGYGGYEYSEASSHQYGY